MWRWSSGADLGKSLAVKDQPDGQTESIVSIKPKLGSVEKVDVYFQRSVQKERTFASLMHVNICSSDYHGEAKPPLPDPIQETSE
jgi:hypothetical protein